MGILNLFSTPVYHINLLANPISEYLKKIDINEYVKSQPDFWKCTVDTGFMSSLPDGFENIAMATIAPHILEYISPFLPSHKDLSLHNSGGFWLNRYQKGFFQEVHNHSGPQQLSFTYVFKTYEGSSKFVFRDFSRQEDEMLKAVGCGFNFLQNEKSFELKEHDLLIFPSWLNHCVTPSRIDGERVTVSGNIRIEVEQ